MSLSLSQQILVRKFIDTGSVVIIKTTDGNFIQCIITGYHLHPSPVTRQNVMCYECYLQAAAKPVDRFKQHYIFVDPVTVESIVRVAVTLEKVPRFGSF